MRAFCFFCVMMMGPFLVADEASLIKEQNAFAFDFYQGIENAAGNLVVSPYNLSLALNLAYLGAKGNTKGEMEHVLYFSKDKEPSLEQEKTLLSPGFSSFEAIAIDKSFTPLPSYLDSVKEVIGAELFQCDFKKDPAQALATINTWVAKETEGKIPSLFEEELSDKTELALLAASYFKKAWRTPFDPQGTQKAPFTMSNGAEIDVNMMHKRDSMLFLETPQVLLSVLDYAKDEGEGEGKKAEFACIIVLPKIRDMFFLVDDSFNAEQINMWLKACTTKEVDLFLPKFKFDYRMNAKAILEKLGMSLAFSNSANFGGITKKRNLKISQVIHQSFLHVDESGTEAASASAVTMTMKALPPGEKPIEMKCNHPFFMIIYEKTTGLPLFLARIEQPVDG